jgi:hypothetical protein
VECFSIIFLRFLLPLPGNQILSLNPVFPSRPSALRLNSCLICSNATSSLRRMKRVLLPKDARKALAKMGDIPTAEFG